MRSEPLSSAAEAELLAKVREGDIDAFAVLYDAQHRSAVRLATILAGAGSAEELVADAMSRVLEALRHGGGPTSNFRAYLHTTIRNLHRDHIRRASREHPASDQPWLLDEVDPGTPPYAPGSDSVAVSALTSLPDSWQTVLWHLEVEGRKPAEVAGLLTLTPAAVSSLAYRAREGLRQAYLHQHLASRMPRPTAAPNDCQWVLDRLGQFVRNGLPRRATDRVSRHLLGCASCQEAFEELTRVNRRLAGVLWPFVMAGGIAALDQAGPDGDSEEPEGTPPAPAAPGPPVPGSGSGSGSGRVGRTVAGASGAGIAGGAAAASSVPGEPGQVSSSHEQAAEGLDPAVGDAGGARAQAVDTASGRVSVPRSRPESAGAATSETGATGQVAGTTLDSALVAELLRRTAPVVAGAGVLGMAGPGAAVALGLTSVATAAPTDGGARGAAAGATDGSTRARSDGTAASGADQSGDGGPATPTPTRPGTTAAPGSGRPAAAATLAGVAGGAAGGVVTLRSRVSAVVRRPATIVTAVVAVLALVAAVAWSIDRDRTRDPAREQVAVVPVDVDGLASGGGAGADTGIDGPEARDVPPSFDPGPSDAAPIVEPVSGPASDPVPPTDSGTGGTSEPAGGGDGEDVGGDLGAGDLPPSDGGDPAPVPDGGPPLADVVTPVAPTARAITTCDEYGTVTLPTTPGVVYALTQGDGQQGPWTVTATPESGYAFPESAQTSWSGDLGEHLICVTAVRPTDTKITTCGEYGSVTWPSITGVRYVLSDGDGKQGPWEVKAFPTDGYQLVIDGNPIPQGYKWSGGLGTYTPCAATEVTPVAPTATPITACGTPGSVALPSTTGVVYALTQGDGQQGAWTVTATPASEYSFPAGAQTTWSGNLGPQYACPAIGAVTVTRGTTPPGDTYEVYDVSVPVSVDDPAPLTLDVAMTFNSQIFLQGYAAAWTCRYNGSVIPNGTGEFTFPVPTGIVCSIDHTPGSTIPPLTFDLHTFGGPPTGSAQARVGGTTYNTQAF